VKILGRREGRSVDVKTNKCMLLGQEKGERKRQRRLHGSQFELYASYRLVCD